MLLPEVKADPRPALNNDGRLVVSWEDGAFSSVDGGFTVVLWPHPWRTWLIYFPPGHPYVIAPSPPDGDDRAGQYWPPETKFYTLFVELDDVSYLNTYSLYRQNLPSPDLVLFTDFLDPQRPVTISKPKTGAYTARWTRFLNFPDL